MRTPVPGGAFVPAVLAVLALPAGAQDASADTPAEPQVDAAPERTPPRDLVVLYYAGLDAFLASPKDRGLAAALRLVDERVRELPAELGEDPLPEDALVLLAHLLEGPLRVRVGASGDDSAGLPVFAQVELGDADDAPYLAELLAGVLALAGVVDADPDAEGRVAVPGPVPAWYRAGERGLELAIGDAGGAPIEIPSATAETGLPDGVVPNLYLKMDYGALLEEVLPLLDGLDGGDGTSLEIEMALLGDMVFEMFAGKDESRSYSRTVFTEWLEATSGMLADEPLPASVFDLVPADALWASLFAYDPLGYVELVETAIRQQAEASGEEPEELPDFGGLLDLEDFDLKRDLVAPLGTVQGVYASDTTGGGGLLSMVAFCSLDDPATFSAALGKLEARIDVLAGAGSRGYARVSRRDVDGARYASWRFPGLPVPLEPTWAVSDGYLFVGATRQAVQAAVRQTRSGAPGLSADADFRAQMPDSLEGWTTAWYADTPRLLREGYGRAVLVATALENAVRSPTDGERDPGAVLPPYPELAEGVLAMAGRTSVRDGVLVSETRADSSFVVNATALVGYFGDLYGTTVLAGLSGALVSRNVQKNLADARQEHAIADLQTLRAALDEYAIDHGGAFPESLDALVEPNERGHRYLKSDSIPNDPWGRRYRYAPPTETRSGEIRLLSVGADGERGGVGEDRDLFADTTLPEHPNRLKQFLRELLD